MTIRELITKIGFDVEHEKLTKVEEQLEGIKHRLEFLAAAEIVKGVFELTEKFAKFGEELHIAAVTAGITVESFQKLAFAASQSNISQEEMGSSMARLSRRLYEAKIGSAEAQKAFMLAGFTPLQLQSFKTGRDALLALSDRFKNIHDPIKKQALAMELMGRGSINMVGFLSQGSAAIHKLGNDAESLGIILSEHQVEALVKVGSAMTKLWGVIKALSATFASYFAPSIESAINEVLDFYKANKDLLDLNVRAWVWDITYAMGAVWAAFKFVTQTVLDFAKAHQLLVRRAGELLFVLGAIASAALIIGRTFTAVSAAVTVLKDTIVLLTNVVLSPFKILKYGVGLVFSALGWLLLRLAVLTEVAFPAISEACLAFAAVLEATPIGWFITAVAALVIILHDAWKILNGGSFKDTWIGQAYEAMKSFGGKALGFLGFGGAPETASANLSGAQNLAQVGGVSTAPDFTRSHAMDAFQTGGAGAGNYQVNAPISITVPPGSDHQMVAQKVKEGVREHLDRVQRDTQRALRPSAAY